MDIVSVQRRVATPARKIFIAQVFTQPVAFFNKFDFYSAIAQFAQLDDQSGSYSLQNFVHWNFKETRQRTSNHIKSSLLLAK